MTRKPLIGVTPYLRKEAPFDTYVPEGCVNAIERLGGEVFKIDYTRLKLYELLGVAVQIDGLILAGGPDVDPRRYGDAQKPECGLIVDARDEIEINLFPLVMTRKLPILGICRGCQVINVAFGGTLTQDLPSELGVNHQQDDAKGAFFHEVRVEPCSELMRILGADTLYTNSYHHQAIKALAPGLVVSATSADGVIEAIEAPNLDMFLLGVQWHPESSLDKDAYSIMPFEAFMRAVEKRLQSVC